MALLQDLIQQIDDPVLRERIMQETDKLVKQKKFGLVFEEHLPECTPLYDVPIRVGCKVALSVIYIPFLRSTGILYCVTAERHTSRKRSK